MVLLVVVLIIVSGAVAGVLSRVAFVLRETGFADDNEVTTGEVHDVLVVVVKEVVTLVEGFATNDVVELQGKWHMSRSVEVVHDDGDVLAHGKKAVVELVETVFGDDLVEAVLVLYEGVLGIVAIGVTPSAIVVCVVRAVYVVVYAAAVIVKVVPIPVWLLLPETPLENALVRNRARIQRVATRQCYLALAHK